MVFENLQIYLQMSYENMQKSFDEGPMPKAAGITIFETNQWLIFLLDICAFVLHLFVIQVHFMWHRPKLVNCIEGHGNVTQIRPDILF